MRSYQQPQTDLKENGNEKEKIPLHPLKSKSKGKRNKTKKQDKETRPGCFSIPLRPRACTRGRYAEAGAAADEIIETCFGTDDDRDLWAYYCYHHDIETILVDVSKKIFKTHFAQCHTAWKRSFAD